MPAAPPTTTFHEALPAGTEVRSLRIRSVLGQGGFGITYLAEHTRLNRMVALKELLPMHFATRNVSGIVIPLAGREEDMAYARDRFLKEAHQLARFKHANIVSVRDVFEENGTAFMVMDYHEGQSLEARLNASGGSMKETELLPILSPIMDALEVMHQADVIHRDLKPANIYLCKDGRPLLLDFGAARQFGGQGDKLTSIVTMGYAPIEQSQEDSPQGPYTDIYALAALLYRCLTGTVPPDSLKRYMDRRKGQPDPCTPAIVAARGKGSSQFLQGIDEGLKLEEKDRPQTIAAWRPHLGISKASADTGTTAYSPLQAVPAPPSQVRPTLAAQEYRLHGSGLDIRFDHTDFAAEGGELVVGRSSTTSHFAIDHASVSRSHFALRQSENGRLEIQDLNSGNGTFINGKELRPKVWEPLTVGDNLLIGQVNLRFSSIDVRRDDPFSEPQPVMAPRMNDSRLDTIQPPRLPSASPTAGPPPLVYQPGGVSSPEPTTAPASQTLLVFAWIFAFLPTIVGLILAIVVRVGSTKKIRPDGSVVTLPRDASSRAQGTALIILSIIFSIIWAIVFSR